MGSGASSEARDELHQMTLEDLETELSNTPADQLQEFLQTKRSKVLDLARAVEAEEVQIQQETAGTRAIADEAQRCLEKAMPALEATMNALDRLSKKDVVELYSLSKPPEAIANTMCAVMTLMQKEPSWKAAVRELRDPGWLMKLMNFDKDNISDTTLCEIEKYTTDPNFTPATLGKFSAGAGAMCQWVHGMKTYAEVAREVAPQRRILREAQEGLELKCQALQSSQKDLRKAQELVKELEVAVRDQLVVANGFFINVRFLSGEDMKLKVSETSTLGDATRYIRREMGIIPTCQKLLLDGTELKDFQLTVQDLGLIEGSLLSLIVREPGSQALEDASEALRGLATNDLEEINRFGAGPVPPQLMIVSLCVCTLRPLGTEDVNAGWAGCRAMFANADLLTALQEFKQDEMNEAQIRNVEKLLKRLEDDAREGGALKKVSIAGYQLLQWVKAMVSYYFEVLHGKSVDVSVEREKLVALEDMAQKDLAQAMPALQAAAQALGLDQLDETFSLELERELDQVTEDWRGDWGDEVAASEEAPLLVKTLCAVLTVMGKAPSWTEAKVELRDTTLLSRLRNLDRDSITDNTLTEIAKYTEDSNWTPKIVQNESATLGRLCQWVHAIKIYSEILREVEPKRAKLRQVQADLEKLTAK
eukprot:TRINITY_DN94246_c0_g1_i1.p1 TRINITY_DN94246_c0_g1~~TRINITY_DN94246_c0_g1_i1.p1  ORF type:complete len:649 (-),score=138.66 TRINITY_DN94246_c0_g1_i1:51-1997(-)